MDTATRNQSQDLFDAAYAAEGEVRHHLLAAYAALQRALDAIGAERDLMKAYYDAEGLPYVPTPAGEYAEIRLTQADPPLQETLEHVFGEEWHLDLAAHLRQEADKLFAHADALEAEGQS